MTEADRIAFYRQRAIQELVASEQAAEPHIRRLHWEVAQQYASRAAELEGAGTANEDLDLPSGTVAF